ncbi:hypothetical protein [Polyangium spumosum]|uniref:Uncharacterized protein n=1 Tax=Polyangium spumosum TaxID=889282 RepID=A0A6N7PEM2_9BACT|nr:hypothetical protein [Polyangium spumosum]MRG90512.1 hypothetical protein [Polyangium spumosum]
MITKKPKTGGEIDSYCTKCKLDLTHRIIAMVGDEVKKVECKTCGSHHLYRRPKSEKLAPLAPKTKSASATRREGGEERKTSGARASAAAQRERDQTMQWEHAIAGQPMGAFKPYRVTLTLGPGELIRHPKFGDGVVARVIDRGKVEILFKDGPKTMAHGQVV